MNPALQQEDERHLITRQALLDGTFLARARSIPGVVALTDEELEDSLGRSLVAASSEDGIWIFAYGSLIWNPAFEYEVRVAAYADGWHRSFCLSAPFGRGTPESPTLFLALNQGGRAEGVAYKLPKGREREELLLVWRREMFTSGYQAEWIRVVTPTETLRALAFVANPLSPSFVGELSAEAVAERLFRARGPLGTALEYLFDTIRHLEQINLNDEHLGEVKKHVDRISARPISSITSGPSGTC
ncbi:gamma-glutamylcyclotransferase [Rhizobium sp. BE258]|uniref:gamma-glutamylcyclotransferase n=1 Tax=Rhizobium sp. BE258 TaxID=2817722 RepID=UPI00285D9551|nr:gamma-glutamylcyclotransferase [Rhizobium sp. BE258]MDR7145033.1 cation transport protein ChaC [Rhizobium sp. BE258]